MFEFSHSATGEIFYATRHSAGFDIRSREDVSIAPHSWSLVHTGLSITSSPQEPLFLTINGESHAVLPEIQIRPRSGLAAKHGITILNAPSTIDADYRGEIKVNLINHSQEPFIIKAGDRIAQGVVALVLRPASLHVADVERGNNGFGSSGKH